MIFNLKKSFESSARNFSFLGVSKILVQVIHLWTLALITRRLGSTMYGQMSVFLMLTQLIYLSTTSWTAVGYTRFSILHADSGRPVSPVFWSRSAIVMSLVSAAGLLLVACRQFVSSYLGLPPVIVAVALFHLLSLLAVDYTRQIAQVTTRFKQISILQLAEKCVILGTVWLWGGDIFSILAVIIAVTIMCRCCFLFTVDSSIFRPFRLDAALSREMLRFCLPLFFVSIGGFVLGWVDIAVIRHFAEFDDVGIYSLAYNGLGAVESFILLMPTIMTPIIVSIISKKKSGLVELFVERMIPQITWIWGLGFIFIGPLSVFAIPLVFGAEFVRTVDVFLVLLICLNLSVFNALCLPLFVGYDLVQGMAKINIAASLLNLLLDLCMVARFGIMGAAVSTVLSYLFIAVSYMFLIRKRHRCLRVRPFLVTVVLFLQVITLISSKNPGLLLGVTSCAAAGYLWMSRRLGIFRTEDMRIYEQLEMPVSVKNIFYRICRYHG